MHIQIYYWWQTSKITLQQTQPERAIHDGLFRHSVGNMRRFKDIEIEILTSALHLLVRCLCNPVSSLSAYVATSEITFLVILPKRRTFFFQVSSWVVNHCHRQYREKGRILLKRWGIKWDGKKSEMHFGEWGVRDWVFNVPDWLLDVGRRSRSVWIFMNFRKLW